MPSHWEHEETLFQNPGFRVPGVPVAGHWEHGETRNIALPIFPGQAFRLTPERWSAIRKTDVVLRWFERRVIDTVSREVQVPAHELEGWRRVFLDSGTQGQKKRIDPEDRERRSFGSPGDERAAVRSRIDGIR